MDAVSLLSAPAEDRDDELPWRYLGARLGIDPDMVPRPATRVVGLKALGYYDPPASNKAKPKLVTTVPCAVFETRDRDGRTHAHRIYLATDGAGKAELGVRDDGNARDPKKSAKAAAGDNTAGRSVLWGDADRAAVATLTEGIETGAAVALAFAAEVAAGEILVAACISAGGIEAFEPWPATEHVVIAADRDERGENGHAPSRRGERAARTFGLRHHAAGGSNAVLPVFIALPGEQGAKIDWLDVLRRDGIDAVRAGISAALLFEPTQAELDATQEEDAQAKRAEEIAASYPLPALDALRLEYRRTKHGEIKVHRVDGEGRGIPVASPFGIIARLRMADEEDTYGLRVLVEDMDGRPRAVDFRRSDLARMAAAEIKGPLFAAGLRVDGDGEQVIVQAMKGAAPADELTVVSRRGWHRLGGGDPFFAAPSGEIIGAPSGQKLELTASAVLGIQTQMGVPASQQSVLPVPAAQKLSQSIIADPQNAPAALQAMAQRYGSFWPNVWRDMVARGGLPPAYQVVGTMADQGQAALLARGLAEQGKSGKNLVDLLPPGARSGVTGIDTSIEDTPAVHDFITSLSRSGASAGMQNDMLDAIKTLAYANVVYAGKNPSSAVSAAVNAFTSQYELMPNGGARVPADKFSAVSTNAETMLGALAPGKVAVPSLYGQPGQPKPQEYIDMLKASPTWITAPSGDALLLMDNQGRLVRGTNGVPLAVPFSALPQVPASSEASGDAAGQIPVPGL